MPSLNYEWILKQLKPEAAKAHDDTATLFSPDFQATLPHEECLARRLPSMQRIEAYAFEEAKTSARAANLEAAMSSELDFQSPLASPSAESTRSANNAPHSNGTSSSDPTQFQPGRTLPPAKPLQAFDIFRALEKKDLELLFKARDHAFNLLVTPHGGVLPLVHCLRLGKSHRDVAILLTGALSRFVNNTPTDHPLDKQRKLLLSKVRANLKVAINESLHTRQTDLISSYLQVILMTEGDAWLLKQTQLLALALRQGRHGKPVQTAQDAVRKFATNELKSIDKLASVEEYTANATIDLVLMGLWSIVCDVVGGKALPLYQYARDDRIYRSFCDSVANASKSPKWSKVNKLQREQIKICMNELPGRASSQTAKLGRLMSLLDES